jgi:hypothetical protein
MNQSLDLGMMSTTGFPESTGHSTELSESTERSSQMHRCCYPRRSPFPVPTDSTAPPRSNMSARASERDQQATGTAVRWYLLTVSDGNPILYRLIPLRAGGADDKHLSSPSSIQLFFPTKRGVMWPVPPINRAVELATKGRSWGRLPVPGPARRGRTRLRSRPERPVFCTCVHARITRRARIHGKKRGNRSQ